MNTTIVKQITFCEDIWREIKTHLIRPKPTCCEYEYCDDRNKPLHSIPVFNYTFKIVDENGEEVRDINNRTVKRINDIPTCYEDTRIQNEEKLLKLKIVRTQQKEIKYYCAECFANRLKYTDNGYRGEDIHSKIRNYLRTENPDWDKKKIDKKTEEEVEWVCGDRKEKGVAVPTPLFAVHRLKKTQDKIKIYEEFAFQLIKKDFYQRIKNHKEFVEREQRELDEKVATILKKRQRVIVMPLFEEIILRKSAKLFTEKKIDVKTFKWINNNVPRGVYDRTISWNDIVEQFIKHQTGRYYSGVITQKNIVLPALVEAQETPQSNQ
jgi:hypothetical protein